ncbi:hypothetical protein BS47DRAFT_1365595 [Hydnum rufescens UP504]|uniref:Uncharacterized protein n=1 Tax=Hydnum rufescens UP504 TaxID=1448309 RepID=A0A9P6ANF3_9AGAM|nr:hypothetical protein BS47DRAFT_1365595 [Hydnum rufescens UP504]
MYGISILAGKKHVKINAYHGTCKSPHACTAPEHATMGNVQHYTPTAAVCSYISSPFCLPNEIVNEVPDEISRTPACYATRSETRYRTPALAGILPSRKPTGREHDEARTKYGHAQPHQTPSAQSLNNPRTTQRWGKLSTTRPLRRVCGNIRLLYMKTRPVRIRQGPIRNTTTQLPKARLRPQPSNVRIARVCGNLRSPLLVQKHTQREPGPGPVQITDYPMTDKTKYHTPAAADVWNGTWCTSPVLWGEFGLHFQY